MRHDQAVPIPAQRTLAVWAADDLVCVSGVAEGEPLREADALVPDDVYRLSPNARRTRLPLGAGAGPAPYRVAPGGAGRAGNALHLDAALTFAAPNGTMTDALLLVETTPCGHVAEVHLHPLGPLDGAADLALVGIDREAAPTLLAELASASFARGTRIALADGRQVPVEALRPGMRVLTRDAGAQTLRWTGRSTLRAAGALAPIVVRMGALGNERELTLSGAHRLFVWQRRDRLGTGRREVLVRAADLIDGRDVVRVEGGFVDWFQLAFDAHHLVYAEGIAAESLMLDPGLAPHVPGAPPAGIVSSLGEAVAIEGARAAARLRAASLG